MLQLDRAQEGVTAVRGTTEPEQRSPALVCRDCECVIPPGAPALMVDFECWIAWDAEGKVFVIPPGEHLCHSCAGVTEFPISCRWCERRFAFDHRQASKPRFRNRRQGRSYCSKRCENAWGAADRRGQALLKLQLRKLRSCLGCGVALADAQRTDARFCSNRCRQRAYRARRAAS